MSTVLPPNKIGTGDSAVGNPTRYSFVAPSDLWIVEAIIGMLYDYSQVQTWFQVGTATPDEAASIFAAIWLTFGVDMATTGVIVPYAGGILPIGWLPCDGASYLRVDYPNLFNVIGTVWGSVDSAHFNVPSLPGVTLVGQGTAASGTVFNLGSTVGEEKHQLTDAELASHTHSYLPPGAAGVMTPGAVPVALPNIIPGSTGSDGGDQPHNNMQVSGVVNYAIIS